MFEEVRKKLDEDFKDYLGDYDIVTMINTSTIITGLRIESDTIDIVCDSVNPRDVWVTVAQEWLRDPKVDRGVGKSIQRKEQPWSKVMTRVSNKSDKEMNIRHELAFGGGK